MNNKNQKVSKSEAKRLELKESHITSNGLAIAQEINNMYGETFVDKHDSQIYYTCLKCSGCIPATLCFVCATCRCGPIKEVNQGHLGFLMELGKLKRKLGPGLHSYNPCTESLVMVDMKVQALNTSEQKLLTKDSVTVWIDVYVNYKIVIPELALFKTKDYHYWLGLTIQSVMKTIVAERTLSQLLINRKEIEKSTTIIMDEKAHQYGIDVVAIETQSIRLPVNMERAMATVAESEKAAEAKQMKAKGSLESSKLFRQAADQLNNVALEVKYFHTLKYLAVENKSLLVVTDSIMNKMNMKDKK